MTEHSVEDVQGLLRAGIDAAKAGDRARARELLMQVVEADERRLQAWLWLSGVVDSLEDREVCLENVLALDPDNQAARRGLAWVREQKQGALRPQSRPADGAHVEAGGGAPPTAVTAAPPPAPARSARDPLWEDPPDVLLCPRCAAMTGEGDRYCPACKGSLWIRYPRRETHSLWLWNTMVLRFVAAVLYAVAPLVALTVVTFRLLGQFEPFLLLPAYLGLEHNLDPALVERALDMLPPVYAVLSFALALYSLLLLVGMYLRWRPAFFLLLAGALARLALGVAVTVGALGPGLRAHGGSIIGTAVASGLLLMLIYEDFVQDTERVYFVLDQQRTGGVTRLERARVLGEQGMWALAVLYLRAATARLPSQPVPFLRLTQAYLRLGRPDLAQEALEQARRIDPHHPLVAELDRLLAG